MKTIKELLKEQRENGEISEDEYHQRLGIISRGNDSVNEPYQSTPHVAEDQPPDTSPEANPPPDDSDSRHDEGKPQRGKRADIWVIAGVSLSIFLLFAFVGYHNENVDASHSGSNSSTDIRPIEPDPEPPSYFNSNRFRNPFIMEDIYNRQDRAYQQSRDSRLINALYASHLSNRMINRCGWELSAFAGIAKGTLDTLMIIAVTLKTIEVAVDTSQSNMAWLQEINDLDMVRRYAYQDLDRFLNDHGGCSNSPVYHLQDGLNWYFVRVAPNLAKE
ncbi:hypothetical protein [Halomonas mongoliensis]|uniref:hypothetical protein n=1 Tax=Halomonas mongoliensis TaxID=321265 RepID=UPI00403AEB3D